jgi:hypothetical protein
MASRNAADPMAAANFPLPTNGDPVRSTVAAFCVGEWPLVRAMHYRSQVPVWTAADGLSCCVSWAARDESRSSFEYFVPFIYELCPFLEGIAQSSSSDVQLLKCLKSLKRGLVPCGHSAGLLTRHYTNYLRIKFLFVWLHPKSTCVDALPDPVAHPA